jgi:predicted nucleic acid-binding protein
VTPADDLDSSCEQSLTPAPAIVLDTNAVLDWLLFADARIAPLASAVIDGRLRWFATSRMRDEFKHVLARGLAATHRAEPAVLAATWQRHCHELPTPPSASARLHCRDPDDQMFLDLALACSARWLVSRDRALLHLRRRAQAHGLSIVMPEQWLPQ